MRSAFLNRLRLLLAACGLWLATCCLLLATCCLPLAGAQAAWAADAPDSYLKPREVAPGVWFVQGEAALGSGKNRNFISNAGFVVTDGGVLVVDALGSPELGRELIRVIRQVTPQPIRHVIVTHYHADHIYGLQAFKEAGATIIAHEQGREYLNSDTARLRLEASRQELAPWIDANTRLVGADRWLTGEETTLKLGSTDIVIQHVGPAHSPEDIVVWLPQRGVLFAGDLVFRGRIPYVGQADSANWIKSLGRLISYQPKLMVTGHGAPSESPAADLALTRDYLVFLRQAMGKAAQELEPFDDAYARTDWSRFEGLPLFKAANRMNAYNTYLLMEQAPAKP